MFFGSGGETEYSSDGYDFADDVLGKKSDDPAENEFLDYLRKKNKEQGKDAEHRQDNQIYIGEAAAGGETSELCHITCPPCRRMRNRYRTY